MKQLTTEQSRVLSFIMQKQRDTGAPPTVREICYAMGYKSINNARQHLRLIANKGYIRLVRGKARGIELLIDFAKGISDNEIQIPIVGLIAAGKPITAEENIDGHITLDRNLFKGEGLFTLRVTGDSMEGIGVLDGDFVIVRQQATAQNNDIVVAIIEGEATLKRYIRKENYIILHAENPRYEDIVVPSDRDILIAGKMVGVIRKC